MATNYKRVAKKVFRKARGAVIKRYFNKGYQPKVQRIIKDVAMLKSMVNAEKKRINVTQTSYQTVAQVNANNSGHYLLDLTPQPAQGVGYNQKTGNSFKWHSSFLTFQFSGQSNNISGLRMKIEVVKVVGQPFSNMQDVMGKYINATNFLSGTIYDINSKRDPDYYKNFRVIARRYVHLLPDQITGDIPVRYFDFGFKLKDHHVKVDDNGPTVSQGQVFLLITADSGNGNSTTASTTTGAPITAAATGAVFLYDHTHYYYDN